MQGLQLPEKFLKNAFYLYDDFVSEETTVWTTTATDSGTSTVGAGVGGYVTLNPSDGTVADNDEIYFLSQEVFKIVSGKEIYFNAIGYFTQANTDDANAFIGLMDGAAANSIQDNGAGPKASFSGAGFYSVDGGANLYVIYSDGSTQTKVELTADNSYDKQAHAAGASANQTFEILIKPYSSAKVDIEFMLDGVLVYKMKDKTYANATETAVVFGMKNGGANQEGLVIDAVYCGQTR